MPKIKSWASDWIWFLSRPNLLTWFVCWLSPWFGMVWLTDKSVGLFTWQHSELYCFLYVECDINMMKKLYVYINTRWFYRYIHEYVTLHKRIPRISSKPLHPKQSFRHRLPRQSFRVSTHGHTITTWLLLLERRSRKGLYRGGSGLSSSLKDTCVYILYI